MAYARLLRIWKGSAKRARCKRCHAAIVWAIDDRGKSRPFRVDAKPLREETDTEGRIFQIFEPTAFHPCAARKKAAPPARVASQPRLL